MIAPQGDATLAALGRELARRGLHARALELWCGTRTLARVPALLERGVPERGGAATPLELFVAGRALPRAAAARALGPALAQSLEHGLLVEERGDVRATCALLPVLDGGILACAHWNAPPSRELVAWPDDSSHHLCGALTAVRGARWLDLGTGSALAPLTCPRVAPRVLGVELVQATARAATLGVRLSGRDAVSVVCADLDSAVDGRWDVITCNAPIPAPAGAPLGADDVRWRHADADFLVRLADTLARRVSPEGLAVLHTALAPLPHLVDRLGGDALSVVYTPPGVPGFAVTWWRASGPRRWRAARRTLTAERPHLDERDRDDADNSRLPPLPETGDS